MGITTAMGSAIYGKLAAGTALTAKLGGTAIYNTLAPQGTACPYVIFSLVGGGDDNTSPRRARSTLWTVKAVSTVGPLEAGQIDDLVDDLLHQGALTVTGWGDYWMARESDFAFPETTGGVVYWHTGATYRVRVAE